MVYGKRRENSVRSNKISPPHAQVGFCTSLHHIALSPLCTHPSGSFLDLARAFRRVRSSPGASPTSKRQLSFHSETPSIPPANSSRSKSARPTRSDRRNALRYSARSSTASLAEGRTQILFLSLWRPDDADYPPTPLPRFPRFPHRLFLHYST